MFQKKYNTLEEKADTLGAPLIANDYGTGIAPGPSAPPAYNSIYPTAPKVPSPPTPPSMHPSTTPAPGPAADSMMALNEANFKPFSCTECSTLNKAPKDATVVRCGVCNTVNHLSEKDLSNIGGSATAVIPPMSSTPSVRPPTTVTNNGMKIISCPVCTAHNQVPASTPTTGGVSLKCGICENVSNNFTVVSESGSSAPASVAPVRNTAAPTSLDGRHRLLICGGCSTRNKVPSNTPESAKIKCGVCGTLNRFGPDLPVGPSSTTTAAAVPGTFSCTACTSLNQCPAGLGPNSPIKCGVCGTINHTPGGGGGGVLLAPGSGATSTILPPGSSVPSQIHVVCGKCKTKNAVSSAYPGAPFPTRMKCGKCGTVNGVNVSVNNAPAGGPVPPIVGAKPKRSGWGSFLHGEY